MAVKTFEATIVKADILLQDKLFPASFDFMYISQQIILFFVLILCIVSVFLLIQLEKKYDDMDKKEDE